MEIQELEKKLLKSNSYLGVKIEEQKTLIEKAAHTEHDYRVALAIKVLTLRAEGMPATIMADVSRGDKPIAKLKLDRDIAKGMADACRQAIISTLAVMSGLQSLISTRKAEMNLR